MLVAVLYRISSVKISGCLKRKFFVLIIIIIIIIWILLDICNINFMLYL